MRITALIGRIIAIALVGGCSAPEVGGSSHRNSSRTAGAGGASVPTYPGSGGSGPVAGAGGTIGPLDPNRDGSAPGAFGVYREAVVLADPEPPPISGGTLTIIAQGRRAAVADPTATS